MTLRAAILTYHSQNVAGNSTADNDHVALAEDLERLHAEGRRVVPVGQVVEVLGHTGEHQALDDVVCLSFDDGCDFDVRDLDYPGHGVQRSMLGILEDFRLHHGAEAQPGLHATSFVIASAEARETIDSRSLFGQGWIGDDWWREAEAGGLIAIENHGWDHNHPDLAPGDGRRGGFTAIDSEQACRLQVEMASRTIAEHSGRRPEFFAYPFGESSQYIREIYFPEFAQRHRCRAAFGTSPGHVTAGSDRWNLPRFVCGRDWKDPDGLMAILGHQGL